MGKIKVQIETSFGTLTIEGSNAQEVLATLETVPPQFVDKMNSLMSKKLASPKKTQLEGIVELTTEGPIISTREKLTHYEAIGLTIFASHGQTNTAAQINQLLIAGGIKSMVPARLNEMVKRGLIFKPDPARPEFRLTIQGKRWINEDVLLKLRGSRNQ
jgi:hypothetical protein